MEIKNDLHLLLIICFSSFLLHSIEAKCVPRSFTYPVPSSPLDLSPSAQESGSCPPPNSPSPPQHTPSSAPKLDPPPKESVSSPSAVSHPPPQHKPAPSPVSHPPVPSPVSHPSSKPEPSSTPSSQSESSPPVSSPSKVTDPAIKAICAKTDNPDLCLSSISPYLTGKNDPVSVLEMQIMACTNVTQTAMATATKVTQDPDIAPFVAQLIEDCRDSYDDAIYNLQSALDAIPARDKGTLNSMLSAAMTDYETCEDGFVETPGGMSLLGDIDDSLSRMASNCLAIATLI